MKYSVIHFLLFLLPYFGHSQEQPAAYAQAEEFNLWGLSVSDTAYTYADNAYLRDQPNLNGTILDSLPVGTMLRIVSPAYGGSKVKGFDGPWHEITYKKEDKIKRGFIWIGLLSLTKLKDDKGNLYLYGFDRFIPSDGVKPDRYIGAVKLLNEKHVLVGKHPLEMPYTGQTYIQAKLLPDMGLTDLEHIFRITLSGEACGIPTDYYYAGWNGTTFFDLPSRYTVSDAGIFYYAESILFPAEHKKQANVIYKLIEEGEAEETDDMAAEIKYSIKRKEERFLWHGKGFTKLGD